jgi:hypothetical protein
MLPKKLVAEAVHSFEARHFNRKARTIRHAQPASDPIDTSSEEPSDVIAIITTIHSSSNTVQDDYRAARSTYGTAQTPFDYARSRRRVFRKVVAFYRATIA